MYRRIFLNWPFCDKEEAKQLGAQWDVHMKKWFIYPEIDKTNFSKWLPIEQKYPDNPLINCPFSDNKEVKHLGGRWDSYNKTWYVPDGFDRTKFLKWLPSEEHIMETDELIKEPIDSDIPLITSTRSITKTSIQTRFKAGIKHIRKIIKKI